MNISKHIIIKEVGTLIYSEVSPSYKEKIGFCLDAAGYCAEDIIFNPPLEVKWRYSEITIVGEVVMVKKVDLEYDFGMKHEFFPWRVIVENPLYWKFRNIDLKSSVIDIVKQYIEDQLIFALHRNPCELDHMHWALRGWLRERAILPWHKSGFTMPPYDDINEEGREIFRNEIRFL